MAATITSTSTRITISGQYKAFTSTSGSTTTVIQFSSGDAPASGDAGRFLMWKNGSATADWEIRYITSATTTTVTVGDGGFSSAPASGEDFVISTNLADIQSAVPAACTLSGKAYSFNGRDWLVTSNGFLADVDISIDTENQSSNASWQVSTNCAVQFGRLTGGEANDSTITRQGCYISMNNTRPNSGSSVFGTGGSELSNGGIVNFYGCYIKNYTSTAARWAFMRGVGPVRFIGSIWDGPIGGAFYHSASELVDTKFRGNTNLTPAWSIRATFVRPVSNVQFANGLAAFKTFQSFTGIFRDTVFDLDSLDTVVFVSGTVGGVTCIDSTTFTDADITDNASGFVNQAKSINYTITDTNGAGLTGVKVAVYDTDGDIQTGIQTSSSGAVGEITATFFKWLNASPSANKAPFDIRLRGYGYQYQDFQSAVSEPIKQEFRIPLNSVTVLSEASAAALTFITIDFTLKTVTVERERTLSEIYDYCQSQLALDANMDEPEFLTSLDGNVFTFADDWKLILDASGKIGSATGKTLVFGGSGNLQMLDDRNMIDNLTVDGDVDLDALATPITGVVADTIDFSVAGNYTLDACAVSQVTNSSGGTVNISLTNGSTVTTNTGPNINIEQVVTIAAASIIDDSRVQIYNVTKAAELDNSVVSGGAGYSFDVNLLGSTVDSGDVIRIRATYAVGTVAKEESTGTGVLSESGLSFLLTQDNDTVYNTLAINGSAQTGFSADYVDDEVDITVAANFSLANLYAWWTYNTTTAQGISDFFGGLVAEDIANFKINNSVVDIFLDNTTSTEVFSTDNRRLYRADGARPVKSPTTGGGGVDVEWREKVLVATGGFEESDRTQLFSLPQEQDIVDGVWDEPLTGATHNDPTSAGRRLRQASAWLSAEGEVGSSPSLTSVATNLTKNEDDFYNDHTFVFLSGPQQGQARIIEDYDGTTKTITFDEALTSLPTAGDEFSILANHEHTITQIKNGVLQGDIESGYSLEESIRLQNAILLGKASQAPNGTIFRDIADTKDRVTSITDDDGNRTDITLDET